MNAPAVTWKKHGRLDSEPFW